MPFDPTVDSDALRRRQELINALTQQAFSAKTPTPGKGSWAEALVPVLQAFAANKMQGKQETAQREFSSNYQNAIAQELARYSQTRQGTPAQPMGPPTETGEMGMTGGQPGDPRQALLQAMTSRLPEMQRVGAMDASLLGKQEAETFHNPITVRGPDGKLQLVMPGNRGSMKPVEGLTPFEKPMVVNDQLVDPATPPGTDLRTKWKPPMFLNNDLYQEEDRPGGLYKKLDNAPKVNVTNSPINAGQKVGLEGISKKAADALEEMGQTARASTKLSSALGQMAELSDKGTFNGVTANPAMWLTNLAHTAGLKVDAAKLANSEAYNSFAGEAAQRLIGQFGGNRGVTAQEAEQIKQIVPQLSQSPQARQQLTAILKRFADRAIMDYDRAVKLYARAVQTQDAGDFAEVMGAVGLPLVDNVPPVPGAPSKGTSTPSVSNWSR